MNHWRIYDQCCKIRIIILSLSSSFAFLVSYTDLKLRLISKLIAHVFTAFIIIIIIIRKIYKAPVTGAHSGLSGAVEYNINRYITKNNTSMVITKKNVKLDETEKVCVLTFLRKLAGARCDQFQISCQLEVHFRHVARRWKRAGFVSYMKPTSH